MDGHRFDSFPKSFGSEMPRRAALKTVGGRLLAEAHTCARSADRCGNGVAAGCEVLHISFTSKCSDCGEIISSSQSSGKGTPAGAHRRASGMR